MAEQYTQNHKTITGKVDRIVFYDQTTGRSILSIIKEDGKYCRVIGNAKDIAKDDLLRATGKWNKDEKYGWQFMSESIENVSQTDDKSDGCMHAMDFSNVLNSRLKEYRNVSGVGNYDGNNNDGLKLFDINGALYSGDFSTLISVPADTTSIEILGGVTNIGWRAFKDCKNLTSIIVPQSVVSIEEEAFSGCSSLASITIGKSVKRIGAKAFFGCLRLTSINISDIDAWCRIGFRDCDSNPTCYAHKLILNGEEIKNLIIPESITKIGNYAFYGCTCIEKVTLSQCLERIGDSAFAGCGLIEDLVVPVSVTDIGEKAFDECKSYRIDHVFDVSWGNVKFFNNYISVLVSLGNSPLLFDSYNLNDGYEGAKKLQIYFDGVDERMNKVKDILKSAMPILKVRMISRNEGEIVNKDQLQKALFIDETIDMTWDDVCFGLRDIYIPSPKGNKVRILDEKIFYMLNGICRDLTRLIPVLHVHFSSLVDAEILNINELHEVTNVLDTKRIFLNSEIPERFRDIRKKYFRSLLPRQLSPYIQFLFDKHAIDTYPIIPVEENMVITAKEKGALFTIIVDGLPHIVWENFNDTRATYVFKCTERDYEDRRKLVIDFINSYRVNKRSYLHSNACISIFGEKPRMIVHNNLASWSQRLMCDSE